MFLDEAPDEYYQGIVQEEPLRHCAIFNISEECQPLHLLLSKDVNVCAARPDQIVCQNRVLQFDSAHH